MTLSDPIRSVINRVNRVSDPKSRKAVQEVIESDILTEPLGQDRDKFRIWSFDGRSNFKFSLTGRFRTLVQVRQPLQASLSPHRHFHQSPRNASSAR